MGRRVKKKVGPLGQTKVESLVEAVLNILVGYSIAVSAQMVVFPFFGIETTFSQQLKIGLIMTVVSIIRSYSLRRLFNYVHSRHLIRHYLRKVYLWGTKEWKN